MIRQTRKKGTSISTRKATTDRTKAVSSEDIVITHKKAEIPNLREVTPKAEPATTQSAPAYQIKNGPIRPENALQCFGQCLTKYEKDEILKYSDIYYIGNPLKKVVPGDSEENDNWNFDHPTKRYKANVNDHIMYRYEIKSILGNGAFGVVLKCYDHKEKCNCAIKIINNEEQAKKLSCKEYEILKLLNENDSDNNIPILKVFDFFEFRNHTCLVFELLGTNIYDYCKFNSFKPLPIKKVKIIAKQIFRALKFIHENGVAHCDLKPENIMFLINSTVKIRLIDFGTACRNDDEHFSYIQSRYYRAPEVILGLPYGKEIDIWSAGCIIAELIKGNPMFPGENDAQQFKLFTNTLGMPPISFIRKSSRKSLYDNENNEQLKSKRKTFKAKCFSVSKSTKISNTNLIDLLCKCFEYDPEKRISAEDALKHPFFQPKIT